VRQIEIRFWGKKKAIKIVFSLEISFFLFAKKYELYGLTLADPWTFPIDRSFKKIEVIVFHFLKKNNV
jgi:hypothetical protein